MVIEDVTSGLFFTIGDSGRGYNVRGDQATPGSVYIPFKVEAICPKIRTAQAIIVGDTFTLSKYAGGTWHQLIWTFIPAGGSGTIWEVPLGTSTIKSLINLIEKVNSNPLAETQSWGFHLDFDEQIQNEHPRLMVYHQKYYWPTTSPYGVGTVGGGGEYNVDAMGFHGVGGSIFGDATSTTTALFEDEGATVSIHSFSEYTHWAYNTVEDKRLTSHGSLRPYEPSPIITGGDRAKLFWTFRVDPTAHLHFSNKGQITWGYVEKHTGTVYVMKRTLAQLGATAHATVPIKQALEFICTQINDIPEADYVSAGFPETAGRLEAIISHWEVDTVTSIDRVTVMFRNETVGLDGNRWFIATHDQTDPTYESVLGHNASPLADNLVTDTFAESMILNASSGLAWWSMNYPSGSGTHDGGGYMEEAGKISTQSFVDGTTDSINVWFLSGGVDPEIGFDISDHMKHEKIPFADTGFGDRTDNNIPRNPLAGHKYRIVPNVEFVPVVPSHSGMESSVLGGLIPPYVDPTDENTAIAEAHAFLYDGLYDFKIEDLHRYVYICGTNNYNYVGWWQIVGILKDYNIPWLDSNRTVAIVQMKGTAEARKGLTSMGMRGGQGLTQDGSLPLKARGGSVRMAMDARTNGNGGLLSNLKCFGFFKAWDGTGTPPYTNLHVTIKLQDPGAQPPVQQVAVVAATLQSGGVVDATTLAAFANSDPYLNGSYFIFGDGTTGVSFLYWDVETRGGYEHGCSLEVSVNYTALTTAQAQSLCGPAGFLQINFLSRVDGRFYDNNQSATPEVAIGRPDAIGFISHRGHSSEVAAFFGDANNHIKINPYTVSGGGSLVPSTREVNSAANGLRWVFSEPLTDRHIGSYLNIKKNSPYMHFPMGSGWTNFPAQKVGTHIEKEVDIFRLNKCPATNQMVVGGDCEVYQTELVHIQEEKFHSIMYSPLGVGGVWEDTLTQNPPSTMSLNSTIQYSLQLINKEKIITISPNSASSTSMFSTQHQSFGASGGVGVGGQILDLSHITLNNIITNSVNHIETMLTGINPWVLMSRQNIQRTNVWGNTSITAAGLPDTSYPERSRNERELWNADNIFGDDLGYLNTFMTNDTEQKALPFFYYSLYNWCPSGEWWQLQLPQPSGDSVQFNASSPPPTLRVDLTEAYTQALQLGGADAKGVRLNKLWVNFGVWGDRKKYSDWYETGREVAGLTEQVLPSAVSGTQNKELPVCQPNAVMRTNHIAFNLVVELPSTQSRIPTIDRCYFRVRQRPDSAKFAAGDYEQKVAFTINDGNGNAWNFICRSFTAQTSPFDPVTGANDYEFFIGQWQGMGSAIVYERYAIAKNIALAINLAARNSSLTPSGALLEVSAQHIGDCVMLEWNTNRSTNPAISQQRSIVFQGSGMVGWEFLGGGAYGTGFAVTFASRTNLNSTYLHSGSEGFGLGGRCPNAIATHNIDYLNSFFNVGAAGAGVGGGTIVIPLYVNRESGDLMPNVMEQFVDTGSASRSQTVGTQIPSDWASGDPESGFGFIDPPDYGLLNAKSYARGVLHSLYQEQVTHQSSHIHHSCIGNPHYPVVWGGIDFDTATNFFAASNYDYSTSMVMANATYSQNNYGVDGDGFLGQSWTKNFTAPFLTQESSLALAGIYPRISRTSGGVRDFFTSGIVNNGDIFSRGTDGSGFIRGPVGEGPASLSAATMTGIVVAHRATAPHPRQWSEGSPTNFAPTIFNVDKNDAAISSIPNIHRRNTKTCPHSFTIALTPVGEKFDPPKNAKGERISVAGTIGSMAPKWQWNSGISDFIATEQFVSSQASGDERFAHFGRRLNNAGMPNNKVGTWLENILNVFGSPEQDGSMLPTGARVFLEISTNYGEIGHASQALSNNGVWVGPVRCSFDVETSFGTAEKKVTGNN